MSAMNSDNGQDVDLNLAPIIDCFTVLIAFLLVSASFLSIGILDAGIAAGGESATKDAKTPPIEITVHLKANKELEVAISGKQTRKTSVAAKSGDWDHEKMTQELAAIKKSWPETASITLDADASVEYQEVVSTMNTIRKTIPVVLLGGF